MILGLGTGSTVAFAIEALAKRVRDGLRITVVPTSRATDLAAQAAGMTTVTLPDSGAVDLCIDGVDEIDPAFRAIKGAGGALLREKVVAAAAARMIAIADATKQVGQLGARPVPVEVLPFARSAVARRIGELGADVRLRLIPSGEPWRTDQANQILDCHFGPITDPAWLAARLAGIAGVLGHGLFLDEIDALYVGIGEEVVRFDKRVLE